jgi:hypothetical protein
MSLSAHDGSCREVENAADSGAKEQEGAPAYAVHDGEHATGCYDEDRILDNGGSEGSVARLCRMLAAGNRKSAGWRKG